MAVGIGFLSVAHMHSHGYAAGLRRLPEVEIRGVWDDDADRARSFAESLGVRVFESPGALVAECDGLIVTSENLRHVEMVEHAALAGKPVLCEKPLVASETDARRLEQVLRKSNIPLMTAFPCRYASAFGALRRRYQAGELGKALAVCATNHGTCPFGWFVDPSKSGGGAMIDHVVHVADLLWVLLGEEPASVFAQTGNRMYGQTWEDTAMLTLGYPSGLFATIDSSWSRPETFKTWGDVTMTIVCERGVLEMDMFAQEIGHYRKGGTTYGVAFYGSDMDAGLVEDFVRVVRGEIPPPIPAEDGLRAAKIALAGYRSVAEGRPVAP
ncbi:MAG: Gfo/Idh/MocA family oxidoreductase [Armatimonadetes bacterium]|jgi:predicted dehydrogenase|nr:Gfo/Idh/MocA family oxidoreductase [Armatimonadota bacterium]MCA1996579.1 Gfo/Idh/MocA family oxidoreductase [Armatimonadota bacterium]